MVNVGVRHCQSRTLTSLTTVKPATTSRPAGRRDVLATPADDDAELNRSRPAPENRRPRIGVTRADDAGPLLVEPVLVLGGRGPPPRPRGPGSSCRWPGPWGARAPGPTAARRRAASAGRPWPGPKTPPGGRRSPHRAAGPCRRGGRRRDRSGRRARRRRPPRCARAARRARPAPRRGDEAGQPHGATLAARAAAGGAGGPQVPNWVFISSQLRLAWRAMREPMISMVP